MRFFILLLFIFVLFSFVPQVSADILFPSCAWNEVGYALASSCVKASFSELLIKYEYSVILPLIITILVELLIFFVRGYRKIREFIYVIVANCLSLPSAYFLASFILSFIRAHRSFFLNQEFFHSLGVIDVLKLLLAFFMVIGIPEIAVIIFESCFLIYIAKFDNRKKTVITVVIANLISFILGLGFLLLFSRQILGG